jgi:hypothetical protein
VTIPQQPAQHVPAPPPRPPEYTLTVEPGSTLEDLLLRLEDAAGRVTAAEEVYELCEGAVKAELTRVAPRGTAIINVPPGPNRPAKRLAWGARKKFRRDDFDRAYPGVYERYQEWGKGFWGWRKAG